MAERALQQRRVAVDGAKRDARRQDPIFLAHPILVDDELYGAVALEVEGRAEAALRELVQRLGWGIGWLEALARRKTFTSKARLVTVLELIATSLQPRALPGRRDRGGDRARHDLRLRAGQHRVPEGPPHPGAGALAQRGVRARRPT